MSYAIFKPKRGTAEEWSTVNPVLKLGEMGIQVCDEGVGKGVCRIKFGDGVTAWKDLPFGICPESYATGTDIDYTQFVTKSDMSYTDTQLDQINSDVATTKAKANTNSSNITQLQTDINSANGRISTNANNIATLQTDVVNAQSTADGAATSAATANTNATTANNTANSALDKANAAMPKANFYFDAGTATLTINL